MAHMAGHLCHILWGEGLRVILSASKYATSGAIQALDLCDDPALPRAVEAAASRMDTTVFQ